MYISYYNNCISLLRAQAARWLILFVHVCPFQLIFTIFNSLDEKECKKSSSTALSDPLTIRFTRDLKNYSLASNLFLLRLIEWVPRFHC